MSENPKLEPQNARAESCTENATPRRTPSLTLYEYIPSIVQDVITMRLFLADVALLQALLHAFGHVGRDEAPELLQVLPSEILLPKSRLDNVVVEPEESLRRLLHTGVFTRETGDKDRIIAARVELGVDGALRENGHLVLVESVGDAVGAVLECELCD